MKEVLSRLRPQIPPALLDGRWRDLFEERASAVPWPPILCYEFRLGVPTPAADLGHFVNAGEGQDYEARDFYISRGRASAPASPAAALGRFLERLDPAGPTADPALAAAFETMTLEYDMAETPAGESPEPGVFVWLRPGFAAFRGDSGKVVDVIAAAVGWDDYRDLALAVERVWEAMPAGLEWEHQIAALPGREPRAVRLVAREMEAEAVPGALKAFGWPGSIAQVEEALAALRGLSLTFKPSMDVLPSGPSPRLGMLLIIPVEKETDVRWLTTGREDWREMVARVESLGWCLPEKARGLLEWPGREQLFTGAGIATCYKGINHLKLVFSGEDLEAKAYCGLLYTVLQPPPNKPGARPSP